MSFGKRESIREPRFASAPIAQQTCVRCCGTGWVRERGNKIVCKPCKGSGRVAAEMARVS